MRVFKNYLRANFKQEKQYRIAIISGVLTQIFFGLMYIFLYQAFYASNSEPGNFTFTQMVSYIWLQQTFLMLFGFYDNNKMLTRQIINGNISYQLLRPVNLYDQWFFNNYSLKISKMFYRAIILIIIVSFFGNYGFKLPISFEAFGLFLITMFLGTVLVVAVNMLSYILLTHVMSAPAVFGLTNAVAGLLSGEIIPLALAPDWFLKFSNFLPFRYIFDVPFRLYIGSIPSAGAWYYILLQLFWVVLCIILGKLWLNKRTKSMVIQGG